MYFCGIILFLFANEQGILSNIERIMEINTVVNANSVFGNYSLIAESELRFYQICINTLVLKIFEP